MTKLVKIVISSKFQEVYSNDCAQAYKEAIKTYMKKKFVPKRKKTEIHKIAWKNNAERIKDVYHKILKGFVKILFF